MVSFQQREAVDAAGLDPAVVYALKKTQRWLKDKWLQGTFGGGLKEPTFELVSNLAYLVRRSVAKRSEANNGTLLGEFYQESFTGREESGLTFE